MTLLPETCQPRWTRRHPHRSAFGFAPSIPTTLTRFTRPASSTGRATRWSGWWSWRCVWHATGAASAWSLPAMRGEGVPVGFGLLTLWPHAAEVSDLTVAPALRGQGIGTALLRHLERAARAMQAERLEIGVAARNTRALALYRRLGFVEDRQVEVDLGEGAEVVVT
ncbi:MAG: GNAT family N-acetyltransferase [Anaerolineae bacterium]|nr:GNAT family N-acetyltransferase [Anaerolineae bacterium]